jgi:hypothetical protein
MKSKVSWGIVVDDLNMILSLKHPFEFRKFPFEDLSYQNATWFYLPRVPNTIGAQIGESWHASFFQGVTDYVVYYSPSMVRC